VSFGRRRLRGIEDLLKTGRIGAGRLGAILIKNRHSGSGINKKNHSITELQAKD